MTPKPPDLSAATLDDLTRELRWRMDFGERSRLCGPPVLEQWEAEALARAAIGRALHYARESGAEVGMQDVGPFATSAALATLDRIEPGRWRVMAFPCTSLRSVDLVVIER
jgi:uncharacterized protein YbjT (DUF2867 family)